MAQDTSRIRPQSRAPAEKKRDGAIAVTCSILTAWVWLGIVMMKIFSNTP
jgi:hypothetical protein